MVEKMCKSINLFLFVCLAVVFQNFAATEKITVNELLDKYAETQEKLQSSFIIKSEPITDDPEKTGCVYETRWDGNRIFWVKKHWGTKFFVYGKERWATKESPSYLYYMWDGERSYSHNRGSDEPGRVMISIEENPGMNKRNFSRSPEGNFLGHIYGNDDRIDKVLRRYNNIRLNPGMKKIGNYKCHHINAVTKEGTFNIWISPELDYNIVKMNASYKEGDIFYDVPVPETGKIIWQVEISDFKQVDGVWVPMEYRQKLNRRIPARNHKIVYDIRGKRTEVSLNPDHEKLNSFGTDFIPNGADAIIVQLGTATRFIWQDGKLVDKDGRALDADRLIKAKSQKVKKSKSKRKK